MKKNNSQDAVRERGMERLQRPPLRKPVLMVLLGGLLAVIAWGTSELFGEIANIALFYF